MTTKHEVIALNRKHPDWTKRKIADELGCHYAYVTATGRRNGLVFPPDRRSRVYATHQQVDEADHAVRTRERAIAATEDAIALLQRKLELQKQRLADARAHAGALRARLPS